MKLDKMKFAKLVCFLTSQLGHLTDDVIEDLDNMIDINIPMPQVVNKASESEVNELLRQIAHPDGFISAIKAYRILTGVGLKEAKQAIECYRIIPKFRDKEPATLGDILNTVTGK